MNISRLPWPSPISGVPLWGQSLQMLYLELGHQKALQRLKPVLLLSINKMDFKCSISLIIMIVNTYLQEIMTLMLPPRSSRLSGIQVCSQPSRPGVLEGEAPPDEHSGPLLLSLSPGRSWWQLFSKHKNKKVLMLLKMRIYMLNSFLVLAQEVKPDRENSG